MARSGSHLFALRWSNNKDVAEVFMIRLRVDPTVCQGIGLCEILAPSLYEVGDDGQAHLLKDAALASELPDAGEAISQCPTGALSLERDDN